MPILHRHIVPDVAAKAANGSIIHGTGGVPSHQRLIKFSIAFDWAPDICSSAYWASVAAGISNFGAWVGAAPSAADLSWLLNTPFGETDYVQGYYGNPPGGYYNGVARYMSTGKNYRHDAPSGAPTDYDWGANIMGSLQLDWNSTNQWWQWRFRVTLQGFWRWYVTSGGYVESARNPGFVELSSAQLTARVRPGSQGIALTPTTTPSGGLAGTNGATLYSAYA